MQSPGMFSREYNELTYQHQIVIETIRQWLILLAGIAFFVLFIVSLTHLLRTWQKWTFDVSVIFICLIEVVLIVLQEFWINNIKAELFVLCTQTAVLLAIVFVFVRFFLKTLDKLFILFRYASLLTNRVVLPMTVILGVVILGTFISGVVEKQIFSCGYNNFSFQWFLIAAINLVLAITTMIFSAIMKTKLRQTAGKIELDNHDIKFLRMRLRQLSVLELWIFIVSIIRMIWYVVAHTAIDEDELTCWSENFYIALSEGGAVFLLIKTIFVDYGPEVIFWVVFYQIPNSFNFLLVKQKKEEDFDLRRRSHQFTLVQKKELINSLIENDDKEIMRITLAPALSKEMADLPMIREVPFEREETNEQQGDIPSAVGGGGSQFNINGTIIQSSTTGGKTSGGAQSKSQDKENPFETIGPMSSAAQSIEGADRGLFSAIQPPKRKIGKKKGGGKKETRDRTGSLMN